MGVTLGRDAVIAATATVVKDVEPWTIVGGNPARRVRPRVIDEGVTWLFRKFLGFYLW